MERCETLARQIKRQDATVSIMNCDGISHRIQAVKTTDHLRWVSNRVHIYIPVATILLVVGVQ